MKKLKNLLKIIGKKIPSETFEMQLKEFNNRIWKKEQRKVNISIIQLSFNDALI